MFGFSIFNKEKSMPKAPSGRPIGGFQFGADIVKLPVVNKDAEQRELEEKLKNRVDEIEATFTELEEREKASVLLEKSEIGGDRVQEGAEVYAEIVQRWGELLDQSNQPDGKTQEVLDGLEKTKTDLEKFKSDIEIWKTDKKERDEFLANQDKTWEDVMAKANDEIKVIAVTKEYFESKNPDLKLTENFAFDLREKIEQYVSQSEEHVDAFHEDEKKLFLKIFAASKMINDKKLPKTCLIIEGKTFMVDTPAFEAARSENKIRLEGEPETDDEKEERTKYSRAGAEITMQRVNDLSELNAPTEKEGDELFLQKTRELWKEFAVHGFLEKDPMTGEMKVKEYSDLDGKFSLELLKLAKIDIQDLIYVKQGKTAEGRINIDTSNKEGVVVEDFNVSKTAAIDHHDPEKSKQGGSAAKHMYRMLVDLGLLEKTEARDRAVEFVTMHDNGEYPEIEKNYFDNSWKTMVGMGRFLKPEALVRFFEKNKNPNPNRDLSDKELKIYGFVSKTENKSERQKNIAEVSKKNLEQMRKDGFIVQSDRYGEIVVSIDKQDGDDENNKNVPGGFLAAKAYGCGAYINWIPDEDRFVIYTKEPIEGEIPQGIKVRERIVIKSGDGDGKLQVSLGEVLSRLTEGKLVAQGKLKEYLDGEAKAEPVAAAAIEEPKEKTPEDFFNELRAERKVFTVERYQVLYNKMMELAKEKTAVGEEERKQVLDILSENIESDITLHTRKRGEDVEKILEYILSQIK